MLALTDCHDQLTRILLNLQVHADDETETTRWLGFVGHYCSGGGDFCRGPVYPTKHAPCYILCYSGTADNLCSRTASPEAKRSLLPASLPKRPSMRAESGGRPACAPWPADVAPAPAPDATRPAPAVPTAPPRPVPSQSSPPACATGKARRGTRWPMSPSTNRSSSRNTPVAPCAAT